MGHPALGIKAKSSDEALDTFRGKGVGLSFFREGLFMGVFASGVTMDEDIPFGARTFPVSFPLALVVKESRPEEWPADFVPAINHFELGVLRIV